MKKYDPNSVSRTTKSMIQLEMLKFIVHILGCNGAIDRNELNFINYYIDMQPSLELFQVEDLIKNTEIFSESVLEQSVSITIFNEADKILREKKIIDNSTGNLGSFIINVFEIAGKEAMMIDEVITEKEIQIFTAYMKSFKDNKLNSITKSDSLDDKNNEYISIKEANPEESLDSLLKELNSLIGLETVKNDVNSLINLIRIRKIREKRGISQPDMSLHLVFSGKPGTGKTTVARLLSKIYFKIGVLSKGHLVEVDRSGLVGGYVGQTALKVKDVVAKAMGGILFVDEAYSLSSNKDDSDYGKEAIDTLLKAMEDNRDDFIVIVAGYPELMEGFLESNPGLKSRFNKFIQFEDYKPNELLDIFIKMCNDSKFLIDDDVKEYVKDFFENRYLKRDENFANARDVRNFFEKALINQANRLSINQIINDDELMRIKLEDVDNINLK